MIIFAYSRKLFMGTFCGIVSLEMETVANDWLASVGNWKWQRNPYSLLSFLGHARSNYRLDSWTSPLCWQRWEKWSKVCNSGHATRSPNALVTCSPYNLWSPHFISYHYIDTVSYSKCIISWNNSAWSFISEIIQHLLRFIDSSFIMWSYWSEFLFW